MRSGLCKSPELRCLNLARTVLMSAVTMKKNRTQDDNRKNGKLALRTETVRKLDELSAQDLAQVAGGMMGTPTFSRYTQAAC